MGKLAILLIAIVAIIVILYLLSVKPAPKSEFMSFMRSILKEEYLPPQKETCRYINQELERTGNECDPLEWSKNGTYFKMIDHYICGRGGCSEKEYLLVVDNFASKSAQDLNFLKLDKINLKYSSDILCRDTGDDNTTLEKGKYYIGQNVSLYLFDDFAYFTRLEWISIKECGIEDLNS